MSGFDLDRLRDIPDPFGPAPAAGPMPKAPSAPSATRDMVHRRRLAALATVVVYEAGWLALVEHRSDLGSLRGAAIATGLLVPLVAALVALVPVVARGRRGLGVSAVAMGVLCGLAPVVFAAVTWVTNPADVEPGFWNLAIRCMGVTAVLTAIPLALGIAVFRHAFATASVLRSTALGVACGAVAAATMSIGCLHDGAMHVIVGHGVTMILGGLVGAWLGARATRV
ncbi:MAG TPA: NrsF family protein [Polyangiaceae bacterium]